MSPIYKTETLPTLMISQATIILITVGARINVSDKLQGEHFRTFQIFEGKQLLLLQQFFQLQRTKNVMIIMNETDTVTISASFCTASVMTYIEYMGSVKQKCEFYFSVQNSSTNEKDNRWWDDYAMILLLCFATIFDCWT
jgi:hypothetical protein